MKPECPYGHMFGVEAGDYRECQACFYKANCKRESKLTRLLVAATNARNALVGTPEAEELDKILREFKR